MHDFTKTLIIGRVSSAPVVDPDGGASLTVETVTRAGAVSHLVTIAAGRVADSVAEHVKVGRRVYVEGELFAMSCGYAIAAKDVHFIR